MASVPKRRIAPDRGERQDFGGARQSVPSGSRGDAAKPIPSATGGGDAAMPQGRPVGGSAPYSTTPESNLKSRNVRVDKGERQDFGDAAIEQRAREGFVRSNPGDANAGCGLPAGPVPLDQRTGEAFRGPVPSARDDAAANETGGRMREYITRGPIRPPPPKPKRGRNNRWYDHRTSGYLDDARGYPDQPAPPRNAGLSRFGAGHTGPGPDHGGRGGGGASGQ